MNTSEARTDGRLLAEFASTGSPEAFEALVRRYNALVTGVCWRILGAPQDAEDVAQAVFLTLSHKAASLKDGPCVAGWLYHVARDLSRNALKSASRQKRREREAGQMKSQDREPGWEELRPILDQELDALPEKYRVPLILHYFQDRTQGDIALELGCQIGTVSTWLHRGRELLRGRLARSGVAVSGALLVALISENAAWAAIPAGAVASTVSAATGTAAVVSPKVAALVQGGLKAMAIAKLKIAAGILIAAGMAATGAGVAAYQAFVVRPAAAEPGLAALPDALENAPPNTWVKMVESKTGGRDQPLFVYAGNMRKFILAGGTQGPGHGSFPRHYDTEEFDLAACRWVNAYPSALAAGRPESGPVGEAYSKQREMHGFNGAKGPFYKDGESLRIVPGGQWAGSATNSYAWCYVPDNGRIYVSRRGEMFCYDTATRTWQDLQAKPRDKCLVWGSLCYDPVNKELLHTGGGGGSADTSTWAYSIEKNEWRRLEFGSAKLKDLFAEAKDLRWQAKMLLGRCASRHAIAETEEEAKVDQVAEAARLSAAAEMFAGRIEAAGFAGTDKPAGEAAVLKLRSAAAALKTAGRTLSGAITPEKIASVRAARVIFEQVVDALAPEPPGRARSQTAYDPIRKKIVLFGGDGLDRTLSDTWLYDCATRSWEQKFPEKCPAPRAGHILAWLPKAGKIVLAGGYSRHRLAQEIWTYEPAANDWKLLLHVPLTGDAGPNSPVADPRGIQVGAVNEGDVLICASGESRSSNALNTWACKIDPSRPDPAGTSARAVASGTYDFNPIDPAVWEKLAHPDPEKTMKLLAELPVNQWRALKFPKYAPGAQNRWGTSAYDTDRHQILLWGGGHATSHENDVGHFSVLGGFWTIGYHPDDPIEPTYASQPTPLSFNDRMHVPMHAYNGYCYDPTAGKMFYMDRAYDPLARDWLPEGLPGMGPLHSNMEVTYRTFQEATPKGAVTYSSKGLFRFDAKARQWQKLPWNGPAFGDIWCDGHTLCYDSQRDCLWLASDKTILRYEMATGQAQKVEISKPKALGEFIFWREAVHLPEADLILVLRLFQRPDGKFGNVAWDPADRKFYWVNLAFVENDKPVEFGNKTFSWSDALAYDPVLKLLVLNNNAASKVWVMRFDRKTARMEEMKDE